MNDYEKGYIKGMEDANINSRFSMFFISVIIIISFIILILIS